MGRRYQTFVAQGEEESPSKLGISEFAFNRVTQNIEPKVLNQYTTEELVGVLRSTSTAIEDFWSFSSRVVSF
jgi:Bacterial toxin 46